MNLSTVLYNIGGKLLQPFVKTEVTPNDIKQLNIDVTKPIIYVLENRGWTDLNILSKTCRELDLPPPLSRISSQHFKRWRSVYTIAPKMPFKAWLLKQPKRSAMLNDVLESLKTNPTDDIQFVPVSIFWGRPVSKQKNWIRILFADSWAIAGRTRKAITILLNGRQTLVNFSTVIHYRDFIKPDTNSSVDNNTIIDAVQASLVNRLLEMRTATLGPDVSHRRTLVRKLLASESLKSEIRNRMETDRISHLKAATIARRYLFEIVADSTSITISLLQRGLTKFWNKFYSGIVITGNEQLPELALTHSLVYVPCHRSHVDYLLLSYIIHAQALAIPYVAAGKNLKMPLIGPILRGAGAFFIRRSFKGNKLYASALFEYIALLISTGMPIEYFIEGGRSRTGRLLKAKPGMLAMTVRAFLKYRKKPVAFIPVYIGYEKMIESGSYLSELSGKKKKSETLFNSIRSIFRIRGEFGSVYANFGKPVLLDQTLDTFDKEWSNTPYDDENRPPWLHDAVDSLSSQILTQINAASTANAINLVTTVLLTSSNQRMGEVELAALLDCYAALLKNLHYSDNTNVTSLSGIEQIQHAETLRLVMRTEHDLGDIIYVDPSLTKLIPYYRNNILHLFILPSVIACCFNTVRTIGREKIQKLVGMVFPYLKTELFLNYNEEDLDAAIDNTLAKMVDQALLIRNDVLDVYTKPGSGTIQYNQLDSLGRIISPILELYYLTIAILAKKNGAHITVAEVTDLCYLMAQRVSLIHELNPPDFADKPLISGLIGELINNDYVKINSMNTLEFSDAFMKADKEARLLIRTHIRSSILQLIKSRSDL